VNQIINRRTITFFLGLIGAIATNIYYAARQPDNLMIVLVFIGCWLFWAWIASLVIGFIDWLQTEIFLMGRPPRISPPSTFGAAKTFARIIGLVIPFAFFYPHEGNAVLLNPEHWALVPFTVYICLGIVAIPLWLAIKYGASKLKGASS
jgi:hypothetical protein